MIDWDALERERTVGALASRQYSVERRTSIGSKPWGPGPWDGEPDRHVWRARVGLPCVAVRNRLGAWCGYVGVPAGAERGLEDAELEAHGGVNYHDRSIWPVCYGSDDEGLFFIGFDCGHAGDITPSFGDLHPLREDGAPHETYRTLDFVIAECEQLAEQIAGYLIK